MNDEFLSNYQPAVRPAFEKDLRDKLHAIARRQRRRTYTLTTALVLLGMVSILMSLPPVQAQVKWWVREVAGFHFVETENPKQDWQAIHDTFTTPTPTPAPYDFEGNYDLDEIVDTFPFILDAPIWEPEAYVQDTSVEVRASKQGLVTTLNWHKATCNACDTYISFEIHKMTTHEVTAEDITGMITQAVRLRAQTATLLRFPAGTQSNDANTWTLVWQETKHGDTFAYRLSSNDPKLTHKDIVKMANSTGYGKYIYEVRQRERSETPMYSLVWVQRIYPDIVNFLPTWVPEGFEPQDAFPLDLEHTHAAIFWEKGEATPRTRPPWFTLSLWVDFDYPFIVKPDNAREVSLGEQTAALWEVEGVGTEDSTIYALAWQQNQLYYILSWPEPALSLEEIRRIAESIPHTTLPIAPEYLGDWLRLMLIPE